MCLLVIKQKFLQIKELKVSTCMLPVSLHWEAQFELSPNFVVHFCSTKSFDYPSSTNNDNDNCNDSDSDSDNDNANDNNNNI